MSKNVLFVAYGYPPISTPGAVRVSRIIKHLTKGDWRISVLSVAGGVSFRSGGISDPLQDTPDMVIRVKDVLSGAGNWAKNSMPKEKQKWSLKTRFVKIFQEFLVPDRTIIWALFAFLTFAFKRRSSMPLDVVYSTSGPASSHLVAWGIAKLWRIPWIAEFRDPLSEIQTSAKISRLRRKILSNVEKFVAKRADQIVVVTPGMAELFQSLYPDKSINTLLNAASFNEERVSCQMKHRASRKVTQPVNLVHTGFLNNNGRPVKPLLMAIKKALPKIKKLKSSIRISFIGQDSYWVIPYAKDLGLENIVDTMPSIDHERSLEEMRKADCCVVILMNEPTSRFELPSKYFDYITTGNPILALGNSNSDLVRTLIQDESGVSFEYNQFNDIADWLVSLANNKVALPNSLEICNRHSTKILAASVEKILDDQIAKKYSKNGIGRE